MIFILNTFIFNFYLNKIKLKVKKIYIYLNDIKTKI